MIEPPLMVAMIDLDMEAWPVFGTFGLKIRRREENLEGILGCSCKWEAEKMG